MSTLVAKHLAKRYGPQTVVTDVSLNVNSGEVVGLLGPNGAGKTTSFYMIVGLVPQDGGRVHLDDINLSGLPMHLRARAGLGYLPQEPSIFRKLTVADNIMAILETRDITAERRHSLLDNLMRELDVSHLHDRRGEALSGGERRLLEISRALVMQPQVLLVDEPSIGLEPRFIDMVFEILDDLQRKDGKTIVMVEQNAKKGLAFADLGYVLVSGQTAIAGKGDDLLNNPDVGRLFLGG